MDLARELVAAAGSKISVPVVLTLPANVSISYYTIAVDVGVTNGNASLCGFSLVHVGGGFPCGVPLINNAINSARTRAEITLGPIHLFGLYT